MKNLFLPYELAVIAKEKGFNTVDIFKYYTGNGDKLWNYNGKLSSTDIIAPLYQQITDWFIENHNIYIDIYPCHQDFFKFRLISTITGGTKIVWSEMGERKKAFNKAIEEAFKLI